MAYGVRGDFSYYQERQKSKQMSKKTDLAYVAGIIDGEGSIGIYACPSKTSRGGFRYQLVISVASTNEWLPQRLKFMWGGHIRFREYEHPKWSPVWTWRITHNLATNLLRSILPYLHLKRAEAKLAIIFQEGRKQRRLERNSHKRTDAELAIEEAQSILMKELKQKK